MKTKKTKFISIFFIIGVLMFSCDKKDTADSGKTEVAVSGEVRGGYRHLAMSVSGDPEELTVYRGDYIKFHLNDQGNPQTEYQLDIPELEISSKIKDNTDDQPYFKMKKTGSYQFKVGDKSGVINVVELRQANYSELSADEAWELINDNPPFLLDVRTKNEFNRGNLKDAALIPLQEIQRRLPELERYKNQPILIYCATGNRSTTASKILLDKGFKNVMNLRMGIMGWASKGYNIQF